MQLSLPILMVANSFNQAYSPWLYKKLSNKEYDSVVALSTFVGIMSIIAVVVYTILAIYFIRWIVGEQYLRSAHFLAWIAFGIISMCIYFMVVNPIFYVEKTEFLSLVTLICSSSYLILGWFATQYFQEYGLAFSYSFVEFLQTIAVFILSNKVFPLPWFSIQAHINGWKQLLGRT